METNKKTKIKVYDYLHNIQTIKDAEKWWKNLREETKVEIADELSDYEDSEDK